MSTAPATTLDAFTLHTASQVVYQIFPERFAIGAGLTSAQKLSDPAYNVPDAGLHDWDDSTLQQPWATQFFGGDLDGIASRLDYLTDLGVTGIYLTPIFASPSNHKYDATDFWCIDPMFGGDAALQRLTTALHSQGLSLTLDAVLNHVSSQHPWFLAAQAGDPDKRNWFSFQADGSYQCWQDGTDMPELNLANPQVRDALYRRPDSLVQHWLAHGVDHWRFDVAQDVGIPVAREMRAVVGARFPKACLLGELNGFSGSWFQGGADGFHGMMNYWYRTATLAWLSGAINAVQMNHAVRDARQAYGLPGLLCSWNMLSSHDTPRLITTLGSAENARLAMLMQFTLPGVPLVYYGEEIGMEGGADPDCRRTMRWDRSQWNTTQRDWVKRLITLRQSSPALQHGDVMVLGDRLAGNALVFLRHTEVPGQAALVIVNMDDQPLDTLLLLPYSHWYDGVPLQDALGSSADTRVQAASVRLCIAPNTAAVYQAVEPYQNYRYFKARNAVTL